MNSDEIKFLQKSEDENKQVSFEIGYCVPFWSSKPIHKYSLDVWREGVITDTIDISNKEYYIVGRNNNICDIYFNNMTISRVHCVIQHKDDGDIFLYDLDSVYGTFINKRPIAKKTYVKLNVGDTFKLGQSNKMFILNGPSQLNQIEEENEEKQSDHLEQSTKENVIKLIDKKELLEKRVKMVKELYDQRESYRKDALGTEIGFTYWGQKEFDEEIMADQREEEDESNDKNKLFNDDLGSNLNFDELKEKKDLSEKQRKMINTLENLLKGVNKIKEEIFKLKKKEMDQGELTEGQKKRIEIDEKKITELYEKYESIESNLKISLTSKEDIEANIEQKFDRKLARELDSDDDEFFDRTKNINNENLNIDNSNQVITENYESLKQKLENMIRTRQRLLDKLQRVDNDNNNKKDSEEIDSLDLYFLETQNQIKSESKSQLTNQINDLTKEIAKTQKLLTLVTPSHIKIKFKDSEEIQKQHIQIISNPQPEDKSIIKKKKTEGITDTINRFIKLKKVVAEEQIRRTADEEDLIMEEADNLKDIIGKEVEMDENFQRKIEEFKKSLNVKKNNENKLEEKSGLIISNENISHREEKVNRIKNENLFTEIVNNIRNPNFDLNNYNSINNVISKNKEEKTLIKKEEIDFSQGGLQTFSKELDQMIAESTFTAKKRERDQSIVYGVSSKPANRNIQESIEEDDNDFDVIYTVGEKMGTAHDLNINPYKRDEENDNFNL